MTELEAKRRLEKSPLRVFTTPAANPPVSDSYWTKALPEVEFKENLANIKDLITDHRISYDSQTIRSGDGGSLDSGSSERLESLDPERK